MTAPMLREAMAKVVLGTVRADELVEIAIEALHYGHDSPSLRALAGLTTSELEDAKELFRRACAETAVEIPSAKEATICLAQGVARRILIGSTTAYEGAKEIWELSLRVPREELGVLDSFIYAASEWEDRPQDRSMLEKAIIEAARSLVKS